MAKYTILEKRKYFRSNLEVDDRFFETGIVYLVGRGIQTVDIWPLDGEIHDFKKPEVLPVKIRSRRPVHRNRHSLFSG